jgi:excinuclease ABC subunit C
LTKEEFQTVVKSIPHNAGVYRYYASNEQLIYVGKAKDLRKRVTSYFNKNQQYHKTIRLVEEIHRIEFTIVNSEQDAFLLENSLIKQYQPKYNIELRDDKTYPYIVIKNEEFPRIFFTRRVIKDGSLYLGPYTSVKEVYELLGFIKQSLPIRTCNLALTEKTIAQQKFSSCLQYHIGNCKAPCIGLQSKTDYHWHVEQIKEILKGKMGDILKHYKQEMLAFANDMQYEKAEIVKKKIEFIQNYKSNSIVVNATMGDIDVCSIVSNEEVAYVNYMVVMQGSIIHTRTFEIEKKLDESDSDILNYTFWEVRDMYKSTNKTIVASCEMELPEEFEIIIPKAGNRKKIIDLSLQNVGYFMSEVKRKKSLMLQTNTLESNMELLMQLQEDMSLQELPDHIECFDNSNFQGAYPVSAMVCFKNAVPDKKEYRHFHIKTVKGIDDFASMKETVYRRYKRVLDEGKPLPKLIIIDGGKGQLSSAIESLQKLEIMGKVAVVGLAKNVEELFFPGDSESLKLPFNSPALNLLKRIRDEVHRFGITFHRQVRSKGIIKNELENIAGIGEATANELLKKFRSVKNIKTKTLDEIAEVVGKAKAKLVVGFFASEK